MEQAGLRNLNGIVDRKPDLFGWILFLLMHSVKGRYGNFDHFRIRLTCS